MALVWSMLGFIMAQKGTLAAQPRLWEVSYQIPGGINPLFTFPPGCNVDPVSVRVVYEQTRQPFQQVEMGPQRGEFCLRRNRVLFSVDDAGAKVRISFAATPKRALVATPVNLSSLTYLSDKAREEIERELTRRGYELIPWLEARPAFLEHKISPDWLLQATKCDTVPEIAELAQEIGFDLLVVAAVSTLTREEISRVPVVRRDPHRCPPDEYKEPLRIYNIYVDCTLALYDGATGRALMKRTQSDNAPHPGGARDTRRTLLQRLIQTAFRNYFED